MSSDMYLWHGGRDRVVPLTHHLRLSERLPRAHCERFPDEGRFSLVIDHASHIFSTVHAARRPNA
jgi:hypothetical protein